MFEGKWIRRDFRILRDFPWLWAVRSSWRCGYREVSKVRNVWDERGLVDLELTKIMRLSSSGQDCHLWVRVECADKSRQDCRTVVVVRVDEAQSEAYDFATRILTLLKDSPPVFPPVVTHLALEAVGKSMADGEWQPGYVVVYRTRGGDFLNWLERFKLGASTQ